MVSLVENMGDGWRKGQEKTRLLPRPRLNPEPFGYIVCGRQAALPHLSVLGNVSATSD